MSKYGVISGPYFPVFGLNMEIYSVDLDTFRAVKPLVKATIVVFSTQDLKIAYFRTAATA